MKLSNPNDSQTAYYVSNIDQLKKIINRSYDPKITVISFLEQQI